MNKIIFIYFITLVFLTLHSNTNATDLAAPASEYFNAKPLCPKNRPCGGWSLIIIESTETTIHSNISGSQNSSFMYQTRDYLANSAMGHLTTEIYSFWGDISFSIPMINAYSNLYSANFKDKTMELIRPSGTQENTVYMTDSMFNSLSNIIEYHLNEATTAGNNEFYNFLVDARNHINEAKGKTLEELRISLFNCNVAPSLC